MAVVLDVVIVVTAAPFVQAAFGRLQVSSIQIVALVPPTPVAY